MGRVGEIVPVIILAGLFIFIAITPLFTPSITVYGVVRDNEGNPISDAIVSSVGDGSEVYAMTDENGHYSLEIMGYGSHSLKAEKDGYWIQYRTGSFSKIVINDFDFMLTSDVQMWIITSYIICNVDLNNISTSLTLGYETDMEVMVEDYAWAGKNMTFIGGPTRSWGMNSKTSISISRGVTISGEYGEIPGQCMNCYVKTIPLSWSQGSLDEFLFPEEIETSTGTLNPGNTTTFQSNSVKGGKLDQAISPTITVSILGEEFTHTFSVWVLPNIDGMVIKCTITNLGDEVTYHYGYDDPGFLHVWVD